MSASLNPATLKKLSKPGEKRHPKTSGIERLNTYTEAGIKRWFRRGIRGYFSKEGRWGFEPVAYLVLQSHDYMLYEGIERIFKNEMTSPATRSYISKAVLRELLELPADDAHMKMWHELRVLAVICLPASTLCRAIPTLMVGDTPAVYEERWWDLRSFMWNILPKAPYIGVRMFYRILRATPPNVSALVGPCLLLLVQHDPQGISKHLKALEKWAVGVSTDEIKAYRRWLGEALLTDVGICAWRKYLVGTSWRWLLDLLEAKHKGKQST